MDLNFMNILKLNQVYIFHYYWAGVAGEVAVAVQQELVQVEGEETFKEEGLHNLVHGLVPENSQIALVDSGAMRQSES